MGVRRRAVWKVGGRAVLGCAGGRARGAAHAAEEVEAAYFSSPRARVKVRAWGAHAAVETLQRV